MESSRLLKNGSLPLPSELRVLVLTLWHPRDGSPGEGAFVCHQVQALLAQGVDVRVFHPLPRTPIGVRWIKRRYREWHRAPQMTQRDGVFVYYPRYLTLPHHWLHEHVGDWLTESLLAPAAQLHREWPFSVIHAHGTYPCGHAANRLRDELFPGVRVVHSIHRTCIIDSPSWGVTANERVRNALKGCDSAICVSKDGLNISRRLAGEEFLHKARVIYNGVDPALFALEPTAGMPTAELSALRERHQRTFNLLFVGYLCERKGIPELLEAFARVRRQEPQRFRLFLVGRNNLGATISRRLTQLDLIDHVELVGEVSPAGIANWMRFADAFVLPSRSEGCPTVLFEALAAGLPSIFTRCGGIEEVISHEHEALLVDSGDVSGIASAIKRLASDDELARELAQRGRELIINRYSWKRNAREVARVYGNGIGGGAQYQAEDAG